MTSPNWKQIWSSRRTPFAAECRRARADLLADLSQPEVAQKRVFEDVVEISRGSWHWRRNGFDKAAEDRDAYRSVLPIMRFDDFRPSLEQEYHTKGGNLTCSPVLRWLKTSGTSGVPKHVPYSLHWFSRYRIPAIKAMWGTYLERHPEILDHPFATLDTQSVREPVSEFVHGLQCQAISNRDPILPEHDWAPPWYDAPWYDAKVPSDPDRRAYHRLRWLVGKDLRFLSAINPSMLISMHDHFLRRGEDLVRDVAQGTIEGTPGCAPDPGTARYIENVLGRPTPSFVDLWPNLSLYSCWLTGSAGLYQGMLDAILPGVDRIPFMSCGTEGVVTLPIDGSIECQPLAINQAFFEFIPATDSLDEAVAQKRSDTLTFDEVEAGRDYHLIMSQANGLYRLAVGDIFRVERIVGGVPWIRFVRRDGVFHSFTGEKLTESQVTDAIDGAFARLGLHKGLYMCGPQWGEPPHYVVFVETAGNGPELTERIAGAIDAELQSINIEYASKRESRRLRPIELRIAPYGAVNRYVDSKRKGANAAQYKYKPFHQSLEFLSEVSTETEALV